MAPIRKWYEPSERKEAKSIAKEKGCYAWSFTRRPSKRRIEAKAFVQRGIYVGMALPAALRKEDTQAKVIYEPKTELVRKTSKRDPRR